MDLPSFDEKGELPVGIHAVTLDAALARFGQSNLARQIVGRRLNDVVLTARATGKLHRIAVFGSFVTDKPEPNDVDILLIMEDDFHPNSVAGRMHKLFDHLDAEREFGATVFWCRRHGALDGDRRWLEQWQITRERTQRGIVELIEEPT